MNPKMDKISSKVELGKVEIEPEAEQEAKKIIEKLKRLHEKVQKTIEDAE